jgi:surface polysaccharide O-acyltransferase-like enzyme
VIRLTLGGGVNDFGLISFLTLFLRSVFNPVSGGWWFVTAYVLLILSAPLINRHVNSLSKNGFRIFLIFVWAIWYSFGNIFGNAYSSLITAFFFYILGAYVKLFSPQKSSPQKISVLIFVCIFFSVVMTFCAYVSPRVSGDFNSLPIKTILLNRICAVAGCFSVPIFSFSLFKIFSSAEFYSPCVNGIASATFGVYLLHDSTFGRSFIWDNLLNVSSAQFSSVFFPLIGICDVAAVFAVCTLIDLLRRKFAEPIYTRFADRLEAGLKPLLFKE